MMEINGHKIQAEDMCKYVESLRFLLSRPPYDYGVFGCPQGAALEVNNYIYAVLQYSCELCVDFIDIGYYEADTECPCDKLKKEKAIKKALYAIWQFDLGEHKWQKGGRS